MSPISRYLVRTGLLLTLAFLLAYCSSDQPKTPAKTPAPSIPALSPMNIPAFQADSAFAYIKKQVSFGPRVPNTEAHKKCASWLVAEFRRRGLTVIEQKFQATHFTGVKYNCTNIIAQYKPELTQRIVFAAHWDSRFQADQDDTRKNEPIAGADDGASGVAVLLEMARLLQQQSMDMGVDFVLFDAEDQGDDSENGKDNSKTWCLGSQHWAKNLHRPNYFPQFGILLDMVGGANAKFKKESISVQAAPKIVDRVWNTAAALGYSNTFVPQVGPGITDDHLFVIQLAQIPMIDIINLPGGTESGFVPHWHTHDDDLSAIDRSTLRIVGDVCTNVMYRAASPTL